MLVKKSFLYFFNNLLLFQVYLYLFNLLYIFLFLFLFLYLIFLFINKNNIFYLKFFKNFFFKINKNFFFYFYLNIAFFYFFVLIYINMCSLQNNLFVISKISYNFISNNLDFCLILDYINLYFIILTIFVFFMLYFCFFSIKYKTDLSIRNIKIVLFLFFIIEILIIITFCSSNIFFFFFFFECSLVPLYILIIILGKGNKKKHFASLSLVFFTLFGSIFLLMGILYLIILSKTCDYKLVNYELLDFNSQLFLFCMFFLGFSVKVPIFPFYSWLPEAHVEASTSISILLASIFLKIATFGLLKIVVFNFYLINYYYYSLIFYFSIISIVFATLLTLIQTDLKKIIALSSIIHMNFIVISLFSLEAKTIFASLIYMFSHAFVSSGLFYLIGILYENNGTRDLLNFNNILKYSSKFFIFYFLFNLANISFPFFISFIAEIIILNNIIYLNVFILFIFLFSIFFSTVYTFWSIHNIFFGKNFIKKNFFFNNKFDLYFLITFLVIILITGVFPFLIFYNFEQEIYLLLINKINIF